MVVRCSLLGHDYGETDVEREREERGSEVVVTVTEYETCRRCGTTHVIGENTEVTSIGAGGGPDRDGSRVDAAGSSASDGTDDPDAVTDADPTDHPAVDGTDVFTDENGEEITDDAEIIDDGPSRRGRGEWPASDDVGPPVGSGTESAAWPDVDDEDRTARTGPFASTDDGDADPGTGSEQRTGVTSVTSTFTPSEREGPAPGDDRGPAELYCPRCQYVAADDRRSLRAGDICPDCHRGYLSGRDP